MPRKPAGAVASVFDQSKNGPAFPVGLCKRKTREAYLIPSDGSATAAEAWERTDHRFDARRVWVPGAFAWWTGGAKGYGHVGFLAFEPGDVWSVDIKRPGFWDRVPLERITRDWPNLREAGFSLDIDGVKVTDLPAPPAPARPAQPSTPYLDAALEALAPAIAARKAGSTNRTKLEQARTLIREVRG